MSTVSDVDLVVGVDTHRDTHTAAVCDGRGRVLSQLKAAATPDGYGELLAWANAAANGKQLVWAIEGTRHYGLGLARHLAAAGQQVAEIDSTPHLGKRKAGKSDPIDAVRAARELLARPQPAQMRADGNREALRLLMIDRPHPADLGHRHRTRPAARTAPAPSRRTARPRLRGPDLPGRRGPADSCPASDPDPPWPPGRRPDRGR